MNFMRLREDFMKRNEIYMSEQEAARLTRRDFMRLAAAGVVVVTAGNIFADGIAHAAEYLPVKAGGGGVKVAVVHAPGLLDLDKKKQSAVFSRMLDQGIKSVTGKSADAALKSMFGKAGNISIKINSVGERRMATNSKLTYSLAEKIVDTGVKPGKILIWDRTSGETRLADYKHKKGGNDIQSYGTDEAGYDSKVTTTGKVKAKFSRILTERTDALINMPMLKTHTNAGISCSLKNHYGSFDKPGDYHGNNSDPFIAQVNNVPFIKNKTKLIVVDATRPQYDRGPMPVEEFRWNLESIIVGTDPVAVDAVGLDILSKKRKAAKMSSVAAAASHIKTAGGMGLGQSDLGKIKVIEVEV